MIGDKVRFTAIRKCLYGNLELYLGKFEGESGPEKWYHINDKKQIFKTNDCETMKSLLIIGVKGITSRHLYYSKIERLSEKHKSTISVFKTKQIA